MIEKKNVGEMTISEIYPYLIKISDQYGLKLNKVKDFKLIRLLLVNLYYSEI